MGEDSLLLIFYVIFYYFFLIKVNAEIKNDVIVGIGSPRKLLSMDLCPKLRILLKRCTGVPQYGFAGVGVCSEPCAEEPLRSSC